MFHKFIKEVKLSVIDLIKNDYKFLVCVLLISIICFYPVNYYIVTGGGISDIQSRVRVKDGYSSDGSFNLSYVSETDGVILTYLLSYIVPNWKRSSMNDYKYDSVDAVEDILFRNKVSLDVASSNAIKVAYEKAGKDITLNSSKTYVISVSHEFEECSLLVGDEIVEINNHKLNSTEYSEYINSLEENSIIPIKVIRNGKEKILNTKVYNVDDRLVIGVYLMTVDSYETTPKTTIQFKSSESGPSAGLMTALEIYNQLVKKDITNGLKIAGTGTIDRKGNVGEIGEVKYKLLGAVKGGADIFIVPVGENYETVKKVVKEEKLSIKVLAVSTFDEALEKLSKLN